LDEYRERMMTWMGPRQKGPAHKPAPTKRNLLATAGSRESTHLGWRQLHDFALAADIERQSETGVLFDDPFDCLAKSYFSPLFDG
jgi:hypothetical protein